MTPPYVTTKVCLACGCAITGLGRTGMCRPCAERARRERERLAKTPPNPSGLCWCGCGLRTTVAVRSDPKQNLVRGEHTRYLCGHHRRLSCEEYIEDPKTGCWVWQRAISESGYGQIPAGKSRHLSAHRVVYERHKGPIPAGAHLDHTCRNPSCVNPNHLEPTTSAENTRRGAAAKLDWVMVAAIRASAESVRVLAKRYGVSTVTIRSAKNGRTWGGVSG